MAIYDISVPIENGMAVWPGDPGVSVDRVLDLDCGDVATVSRLNIGSHTGTHVDAFSHFKPGGASLDEMDLNRYIGKALVVALTETPVISREALQSLNLEAMTAWDHFKRLILKTDNSATHWSQRPFNENFVHLTPDGAVYLTELGIHLVGVDYLSVDGFKSQGAPVHHRLLDHGVYILEGLALKDIVPGWYELLCLPLKVRQGDGAPARVVLRTLPATSEETRP